MRKYWLINTLTLVSSVAVFSSAALVIANKHIVKKQNSQSISYSQIFPKVALKDNAKLLLSKPSLISKEDIIVYNLELFKNINLEEIVLNADDKKQTLEIIIKILDTNTKKVDTFSHIFKFLDTISPTDNDKFAYTMINFLKDKTFDLKESLKRTYQDDSSSISVFEAQQNLIIRDKDNNVIPENELPFKEITNITNIEHLPNKQLKLKNISFKDKDNNIYTFADYTNIIDINLKNS